MSQYHKYYERFSVAQRIEHLLLIISFSLLAITGLVQKFSMIGISQAVINILGGIEVTRIIHRVAAIVFALEAVYHAVVIGYKLYVMRKAPSLLPKQKDAEDALQVFFFNLGLKKDHPRLERFNFVEKAEYWAVIWGLVLMGLTGFMLWNPIATTRFMPGQFIPAAKVAHGAEAVLAVLAIIVWHFYNVHFRDLNLSMLHGKLTRKQMEHEHSLELEAIENEIEYIPPSSDVVVKRRSIYFPVSGVITVVLVVGIYFFATFEETAITTVPPYMADVVAFVPQTATPAPTAKPTSEADAAAAPVAEGDEVTWANVSALFDETCAACHGEMASYDEIINMAGWIVPGDAGASSIVEIQAEGGHLGQFDDAHLTQVTAWINAGAQKGEGESIPSAEVAEDPDYCVECHTDKETLIAVAEAEEEEPEESSGPG